MSIQELQEDLKAAKLREAIALQELQDANEFNEMLAARNRWLEARVRELENPKGRRHEDRSWVDKISLIIGRVGRPMRSREIMHELKAMDRDAAIEVLDNPEGSLSVALEKGGDGWQAKAVQSAGHAWCVLCLAEVGR